MLIRGASYKQQRHTEALSETETLVTNVLYSLKAFWQQQHPFEMQLFSVILLFASFFGGGVCFTLYECIMQCSILT